MLYYFTSDNQLTYCISLSIKHDKLHHMGSDLVV